MGNKRNHLLNLLLFLFAIYSSIDFWLCVCYKPVAFTILAWDIDDVVIIWKCVYSLCNIRFAGKMKHLTEIAGTLNK